MKKIIIPEGVKYILETLNGNNYEGYVVGGAVRDYFLKKQPKDWDIATNAEPSEIKRLFPNNHPIGERFGMIQVLINDQEFEVTTYREDGSYEDSRRPSSVKFLKNIHGDLSRRDFTINAMAYNPLTNELIDPFNGRVDLKHKIIKTVGNPDARFGEDALRMMRAVRFASKLHFVIELDTYLSIIKNAPTIKNISCERVRDELIKIIMSDTPSYGLRTLKDTGLLHETIPEFDDTVCVGDFSFYPLDIFEHTMQVLDQARKLCEDIKDERNKIPFLFAALLHDIGKPEAFPTDDFNEDLFKDHHKFSFERSKKILKRLKFDNKFFRYCTYIVLNHSILYKKCAKDKKSIRMMIHKYGKEYVHDIITHKIADKIGSGQDIRDVEVLYQLRKDANKMISQGVAVEVQDLEVNGGDVMDITGLSPCVKVRDILEILLGKVLECPSLNKFETLKELIKWDTNIRAIWHTEKMEHPGDSETT